MTVRPKPKLIEVALPLEAINQAAAREKTIRHGHPSTFHLWWARRPLAAARAVLFAQLVDDPSAWPDRFPTVADQQRERQRLFRLIERLVPWEHADDPTILAEARAAIHESWRRTCAARAAWREAHRAALSPEELARDEARYNPDQLPVFHDPFAGGGSLPLEAQRLGMVAYASDLNPVAVLINKALIDLPAHVADQPPVNPQDRASPAWWARTWRGAQGLAADVRFYSQWMREEAAKRIGHLYPAITITADMVRERPDLAPYRDRTLPVVAWLWARTVKSPNPAFAHVDVPLISTFILSTKPGHEAYLEPVIEGDRYRFVVAPRRPADPDQAAQGTKAGRGAQFRCLCSGAVIDEAYLKAESRAGRLGTRLLAIVAHGDGERIYLAPSPDHEEVARRAHPLWTPDHPLHGKARGQVSLYGMTTWTDLFTARQLVALTTFADLVTEAMARVEHDYRAAADASGLPPEQAAAYARIVATYLAMAVDKCCDYWSMLCTWHSAESKINHTFMRHAIPMTWDYAEANPFSTASGNWTALAAWVWRAVERLPARPQGYAWQADARTQSLSVDAVISTDPPYHSNIVYADLADFFYVWLRRMLRPVLPDLFATLATPKAEELVVAPDRHDSAAAADQFFLDGLTDAMRQLVAQAHPAFPITIYYAFKQQETADAPSGEAGTSERHRWSTGWERFLDAVMRAGLCITATWPIRTELASRVIGHEANALTTSMVVVCRPRPAEVTEVSRRDVLAALRAELPPAIRRLQGMDGAAGAIAPVDLAQAALGLGMAIVTRYAAVRDASGALVPVRELLAMINQVIDATLADDPTDLDPETRWAVAWFEQYGFGAGPFGVAETLAHAKNVPLARLAAAGMITMQRGKVRLIAPADAPAARLPAAQGSVTRWQALHHLIRILDTHGEQAAAAAADALGDAAAGARDLAYRLYAIAERMRRPAEARIYTSLIQRIDRVEREPPATETAQLTQACLFPDLVAESGMP